MPQVFGPGPKGLLRNAFVGLRQKHLWCHRCCAPPDGQYQGGGLPGKTIISGAAADPNGHPPGTLFSPLIMSGQGVFWTMSLPATAAKPYCLDAPGVFALRTLMWYYWYVAREASQYKATWGWGMFRLGQYGARRDRTQARTLGETVALETAHYR